MARGQAMRDSDRLVELARGLVNEWNNFFAVKGPGAGDRDTKAFMDELRKRAEQLFGADYAEQCICGETQLRVDYYFPEEATIVEIAMGLRNPTSEFERDLLKAIMARESNKSVRRLLFLCKPGGRVRCQRPGAATMIEWMARAQGISVEIVEFEPKAEVVLESE